MTRSACSATFVDLQEHALAEGEDHRPTSGFLGMTWCLGRKRDVPEDVFSQLEFVWFVPRMGTRPPCLGCDIDVLLDFWREHFQLREPIVVFQIDEVQLCEQLGYRKFSGRAPVAPR